MRKELFFGLMLVCACAFARPAGDVASGMDVRMAHGATLQTSLALSSLRGKYVVLDFWGSWCAWCIKGFPEMKEAYAKYKDKMEIVGIACRDTEKRWKAAVEKHQLPWLNVLNEGDVDVSALYAVEGYPTKVVISPEGKILKVVVGESPEFYTYLEELFK